MIKFAKDELGNTWEFKDNSCNLGTNTLQYKDIDNVVATKEILTFIHDSKTFSFIFDTPFDAASVETQIGRAKKSPVVSADINYQTLAKNEFEDLAEKDLLIESIKLQRNIDKNITFFKIVTIVYIVLSVIGTLMFISEITPY